MLLQLYKSKAFVNCVVLLGIIVYMYKTYTRRAEVFGIGTTHESANTTNCYQFGQDLDMVQGCEDIHVDPRSGLAYLACGNIKARTRWILPGTPYNTDFEQYKDHVVVIDEQRTQSGALVPFTQDLRLHGFDIFFDDLEPGLLTFMFVNHQRTGNAISIFSHRLGTIQLVHEETVSSPLLPSPNDVVAMSHTTFYATNDVRHTKGGRLRSVEEFFGMPWGHLVYRGPEGMFSIAAESLSYPNGITKSADGSLIYVACSSEPGVRTFRPNPDGSLEYLGGIVFKGLIPDNLFVDAPTGHIYVAGYLNTMEMFRYNRESIHGTTARPAAGIYRLKNVMVDGGDLLPTTTVSAVQRRGGVTRILLGSVMSKGLAICDHGRNL
ncbi:calcium-dependent phosphotriesterase [Linderina pennispora]|uniref:Calcium-dependent phosphotriesterase n=1 Tax=Linderina pennispora TaxID=61395 RepID=A0A1Y1W6G1_9FUNG|nr:calcium-dependent phosphotriesterase [Linderina pennispora]ORX69002.1 calcium-dependent phosphotriesterase [Linderina pennispora]